MSDIAAGEIDMESWQTYKQGHFVFYAAGEYVEMELRELAGKGGKPVKFTMTRELFRNFSQSTHQAILSLDRDVERLYRRL